MADLRRAFDGMGCKEVMTYIQSGNVLFERKLMKSDMLSVAIEKALAKAFPGAFPVVVLTREQLERVIKNAPPGFGDEPARYRYDVVFVRPAARAHLILPTVSLKHGVDEAFERNGVLYLKRLASRASQSHFPRLTRNVSYSSMTIRNWKTTTELCRLLSTGRVPITPV